MSDNLTACCHCGSPGRALVFYQSKIFDQGSKFYVCSNNAQLKDVEGTCHGPIYFSAENWNNDNDGSLRDNRALGVVQEWIRKLEGFSVVNALTTTHEDLVSEHLAAQEALCYLTSELAALRQKVKDRKESETSPVNPVHDSLQRRKDQWMRVCFEDEVTDDPAERNRRFIEEALETVQSCGMAREEAHFMVDYTFNREIGHPAQEIGGALLSLLALGNAHAIDVLDAAETELTRVWHKVDAIRVKWESKPKYTSLVETLLYKLNPAERHTILYGSVEDGLSVVANHREDMEPEWTPDDAPTLPLSQYDWYVRQRLRERLVDVDIIAEHAPVVRSWYERNSLYNVTPEALTEDKTLNDT